MARKFGDIPAIVHGQFKTAYLQRAAFVDAIVADAAFDVGVLVKLDLSGTTPALVRASGISDATHIIAQSDMTLIPGDHPRTELGDYRYSKVVKSGSSAFDAIFDDEDFCGVIADHANLPGSLTADDNGKQLYALDTGKLYEVKGTGTSPNITYAFDSGTAVALGTAKHVALYPIFDKNDVILA